MAGKNNWIQTAVRHPGSLREWFQKNKKKLEHHLHYDPLDSNGEIKKKAVNDVLKLVKEGRLRVQRKTLHRLYLARTLFRLQSKKHRKTHKRHNRR